MSVASGDAETGALLVDLVAYWELNEASGTRFDQVGSLDLTDNNTVSSGTGLVGTAADFEASNNEYLSVGDDSLLSISGDFTIATWVKLESLGVANTIVGKRDTNAVGDKEYTLIYRGASTAFRWTTWDSSGNPTSNDDTSVTPATGTWYFLMCGYNSGTGRTFISVNNGTKNTFIGTVQNGGSDFKIGAQLSTPDFYFDGLIDEFGVWQRLLTTDEEAFLYNSGSGRSYSEIEAY